MSLTVSPELLETAKAGPVSDEQFLACVEESLPYAWGVVNKLVAEVGSDGYAVDRTNPPTDQEQGQLLRFFASDPMKAAAERHFGVKLVFQNCCTSGAFQPDALSGPAYQDFVSARGQLLNQSPEFVNC